MGNNGAVHLYTGVNLQGRALTTNGAVTTATVTAVMPTACTGLGLDTNEITKQNVTFYPNPFSNTLSVTLTEGGSNALYLYSATGALILKRNLIKTETTIDISVPAGIYLYKIVGENGHIITGKLLSAN